LAEDCGVEEAASAADCIAVDESVLAAPVDDFEFDVDGKEFCV